MGGYRADRIAVLIQRELSMRLRTDVKDPRVTDVTITHVSVSGDLRRAVVEWMPLGGGEPSDELVEGLAEAARKLRGPIGRALRLRNAPELIFRQDEVTEDAFRVSQLIEELSRERAEQEDE